MKSTTELIEEAIEQYLSNLKAPTHSHYSNELLYGYCENQQYELQHIDIESISAHIALHLTKFQTALNTPT